jgi:acyl-CoA dehydrogenase
MKTNDDSLRSVLNDVVRSYLPTTSGTAAFQADAWRALETLGFVSLLVPESLGGSGGSIEAAAVVLEAAATLDIPLAESLFIVGPLLSAGHLPWPEGVVTGGVSGNLTWNGSRSSALISGVVPDVEWGNEADTLVLAGSGARPWVAVIPVDDKLRQRQGHVRGSSTASVVLEQTPALAVSELPNGEWDRWATAMGATSRVVQMAAVARNLLSMCIDHITVRRQFGRVLSDFQVVQHELAELAERCALLEQCARAAIQGCQGDDTVGRLLVASAKAEASASVSRIVGIAHQLHGAMGYTAEHPLASRSIRLLRWREQHGNERHWRREVADMLAREDDAWDLVTRSVLVPGAER